MKLLHAIAKALVLIGAINWGLVGLFNFNLVTAIFGSVPMVEQWIYILVGLSGLWILFTHKSYCMYCGEMGMKWDMGGMEMKKMKGKMKK
ncbi:MAG TPA: DUF378 domain-containing protein [Patescibacteria group bacterium]